MDDDDSIDMLQDKLLETEVLETELMSPKLLDLSKKDGKKKKHREVYVAQAKAKEIVAKTNHHCTVSAGNLKDAQASLVKRQAAVLKALAKAKAVCQKEEKKNKVVEEKRVKMSISGPTFKFDTKNPCKGGRGSFTMNLKQDQRVGIGVIPANMNNVWVKLRTDKDVDTELWTGEGDRELAIVAWEVGKINSPTAASIKYEGGTIKYSGYNGINGKDGSLNFGHEDIQVVGKSRASFTMKAFAFQAGTAKVTYSWGADVEKCKAMAREKKAKHDQKASKKRAAGEKEFKAVLKVAQSVVDTCEGAQNYEKASRKALKEGIEQAEGKKIKLKKCHKDKEKYTKHLQDLSVKEKKMKEVDKKEAKSKKEKASKQKEMKIKKEKTGKEKQNKEKKKKSEKAAKEKKSKEVKSKESSSKREHKHKESSKKAEKTAKERNTKEKSKKKEAKS